jgi:SAM domain (Sterile alpha motif)
VQRDLSAKIAPSGWSEPESEPGHGAAMQEIADWLEKLGMSEYAQRFIENDIDLAILGDLTDQDLEKLGVASLGHRRKLLRAIAALKGAAPTPATAPSSLPPPIPPDPTSTGAERSPPSSGERRPRHGDVLRPCRSDSTFGPHGP